MHPSRWLTPVAFLSGIAGAVAPATAQRVTAENVILVTMDGLRWQEVFDGAALALMNRGHGGVADSAALVKRFWRETPEERRAVLLPFLWTIMATRGQIFGDSTRGSAARVTNGLRFSYPGYNELLAGAPDPRIASNDTVLNPNVTVLEWLNGLPRLRGRVAAFGSWEVLPYIVNARRSGVFVNGDGPPVANPRTERDRQLNDFAADLPPYWGSVRFDAATMQGALEYFRTQRPRVLYVMLGDTDEWAHERRYDLYLDAAWRGDRFIRRLWEAAQSLEPYAGRTALLVATDHGRGAAPADWTDHGRDVPAAERIWIAALGPDTPALGVRDAAPVTQAQVAATVAAVLGEDFRVATPRAAPPLPGVVARAVGVGLQERPDFSGRWTQVTDSTGTRPSVSATGDARFALGDMGSGWGSPLTITQRPDSLIVEYTVFSAYDLQPPLRLAYALDGSETRNTVMISHAQSVQRSTVAWQGGTLVITTTHAVPGSGEGPRVTEVRQALSLTSATSLVVETTRAGVLGGPTTATRTVYRRGGP